MRMTRQHFQMLADIINGLIADGTLCPHDGVITAARFAIRLAETNPNFDCSRFYDAATRDLPRIESQMVADLT